MKSKKRVRKPRDTNYGATEVFIDHHDNAILCRGFTCLMVPPEHAKKVAKWLVQFADWAEQKAKGKPCRD